MFYMYVLIYIKVIVEKHNGTITIDSELGQGSVFTIYLPFNVNNTHK